MPMNIEAHQKIATACRAWPTFTCASQRCTRSSRTPRALTASMRFGNALSRWARRKTGSVVIDSDLGQSGASAADREDSVW